MKMRELTGTSATGADESTPRRRGVAEEYRVEMRSSLWQVRDAQDRIIVALFLSEAEALTR